jgi:exopolyphosphatase/guanosine-5'-triphosphate,3'-diphosphate pyrophosphatase
LENSLGVIDIGSNTVLLTGGQINSSGELEVILECYEVARLSEGLVDQGPLLPKAKSRVLFILKDFQKQAHEKGIIKLLAAGTAAFRRASDGENFAKEIEEKLGIPVKILTGGEEAHFSYLSARIDGTGLW